MPVEAPINTKYYSAEKPFNRLPSISQLLLIGDGQLAYLTGRAAQRAGLTVGVIGNSADRAGASVANTFIEGDIQNDEVLSRALKFGWNIGLDTEHVATETLLRLQTRNATPRVLFPVEGLRLTQDKLEQHRALEEADLPMPSMVFDIQNFRQMEHAAHLFGFKSVLQTGNAAYDGRGNAMFRSEDELENAWEKVGEKGKLFMEELVPFEEEIAVQVARDGKGGIAFAPPVRSLHVNQQLYFSETNAVDDSRASQDAIETAMNVSEFIPGPGLLTVELLRLPYGTLNPDELSVIINEICLGRPHNSHHLTEGPLEHSQFDQIVRLAQGKGVGSYAFKEGITYASMLNLIGARKGTSEINGLEEVAAKTSVDVSWYGKSLGDNRKVGHVNAWGIDRSQVKDQLYQAREILNANNNNAFQEHDF